MRQSWRFDRSSYRYLLCCKQLYECDISRICRIGESPHKSGHVLHLRAACAEPNWKLWQDATAATRSLDRQWVASPPLQLFGMIQSQEQLSHSPVVPEAVA